MIALAFLALAGGAVLVVAGVSGSSVASAASGHPDHANTAAVTGGTSAPAEAAGTAAAAGSSSSGGPAGQVVYHRLTTGPLALSGAQAAGVIGNLQQESNVDPTAAGGGMAQWIGDRWAALLRFAHARGSSPTSAALQTEYLEHELTTSERGVLLALKHTTTPAQAARVFSEQFERPGIPMLANRERYANEAFARYAK